MTHVEQIANWIEEAWAEQQHRQMVQLIRNDRLGLYLKRRLKKALLVTKKEVEGSKMDNQDIEEQPPWTPRSSVTSAMRR